MRFIALVIFLVGCHTPNEIIVHENVDIDTVKEGVALLEEAAGCKLFKSIRYSSKVKYWKTALPPKGVVTVEVDASKVRKGKAGRTIWGISRSRMRIFIRENAGERVLSHECGSHVLNRGHIPFCGYVFTGADHCDLIGSKFLPADIEFLKDQCLDEE